LPLRRWLHGKIERHEAEALLNPSKPGAFLVRESSSIPGNYSLSIQTERRIQHIIIRRHGTDPVQYEMGGRRYSSLDAIVQRYTSEPVIDGLTLTTPVETVTPMETDTPDIVYGEIDREIESP
jgi:hypothetical protein